jgi:hypothetical protein
MRLYGEDFVIDETIWIGHVVDGRRFKLDGKSGKARLRLLRVQAARWAHRRGERLVSV